MAKSVALEHLLVVLVMMTCGANAVVGDGDPEPIPPDAMRAQQWGRNSTRIAVVQLPAPVACGEEAKSCTHPVTAADMDLLVQTIAHASQDGADLLLAPEYHLVNIHLDTAPAGHYTNPAVAAVSDAARRARMYVAVGSWVLWTPGQQRVAKAYTNSILLFGRDGVILGMYNKTHAAVGQGPFCWPPLANDTEWEMVPGASYPVFDLDFARVGIQTCYDGYFPEPMRALALQGAEIVLWPNSRGGSIEPDLVSAGAFFNVVHVAAVNSANGAGSVIHAYGAPGGSVAGPCTMNPGKLCYLAANLDLHTLRVARKNNRMFHQRRAELARPILGNDWATSEFYSGYPG